MIDEWTTINFEMELIMIESKNLLDFCGLKCYKCHLMSQSHYSLQKDNPNNVLLMSWSTHQRFDGLHTIHEHLVPQIAISYVRRSNEMQFFEFMERERVTIAVECVDDMIFGVMRERMKAGVQVDEATKTILCGRC